jgi:hypothetical protein
MTAIKITSPPPKNTSGLSFSELGLYTYMMENVDSSGSFQQHLDIMATAGRSTAPTVYRWQKALIDKGMVLVVKKSYRTRTGGYQVPPVLRPVPLFHEQPIMSRVEQVNRPETKRVDPVSSPANPVPNGMLEPTTVAPSDIPRSDPRNDSQPSPTPARPSPRPVISTPVDSDLVI